MSTKLKIIILLLFLVQGAVIYWSYSDKEKAQEIELLPYKAYLENPFMVTSMDLSNQKLEEIAVDFSLFPNLEYLDLSGNLLEEIPNEIFELTMLKTLIVANNRLLSDFSFPINKSIQRLDLSDNNLHELQYATCFACLENLKYLNLNNNSLSEIPNLTATKIDTILLQNNLVDNASEIDVLLPTNHLVKYLDLSKNGYAFDNFNNEKRMETINCNSINLSENYLSFPYNLFDSDSSSQLKKLNLSNCNFTENINKLAYNNIEILNLSGNKMSLNKYTFQECRKLKYLDISGSNIYDFDLMNFRLNYLSIDLEKGTFLLLPNLDTLSINGDIGNDLDVFFTLDLDSGYFEGLELPNLKTIKIRNYEDNNLKSILKKQFPNVEIVIESYKEEIVIDKETEEEFEQFMMEQIEKDNN